MTGHAWPGNIRELQNLADRLISLWVSDPKGPPRGTRQLREVIRNELLATGSSPGSFHAHENDQPLKALSRAAERARIDAALAESSGKLEAAAAALGISRTTLWRKLRRSPTGS